MHSATTALLVDGPLKGKKLKIEPGQQRLEDATTFDYDQGRIREVHGYQYEKPLPDNDQIAVFVHRKTWKEPA